MPEKNGERKNRPLEKAGKAKRVRGINAYDEALYFLTPKPRTVREVENRLDECDFSEIETANAVERLLENGLLDDRRYARDFVESRLNTKPVSRRKLTEQLEGHFVEQAALEEAIAAVTDEVELENARTVGKKFFRQFRGLELSERLRRVGLRLAGRGYGFDDTKLVLTELSELPEDDGDFEESVDDDD